MRRLLRDESGAGGAVSKLVFDTGTTCRNTPWAELLVPSPKVRYIRGSDWGGGVGSILYTIRPENGAAYDQIIAINRSSVVAWDVLA